MDGLGVVDAGGGGASEDGWGLPGEAKNEEGVAFLFLRWADKGGGGVEKKEEDIRRGSGSKGELEWDEEGLCESVKARGVGWMRVVWGRACTDVAAFMVMEESLTFTSSAAGRRRMDRRCQNVSSHQNFDLSLFPRNGRRKGSERGGGGGMEEMDRRGERDVHREWWCVSRVRCAGMVSKVRLLCDDDG